MKKEKNDALEVQDPPEEALSLMSDMPDYLLEQTAPARGGENVEPGDTVLPRLAVCSKQTPQFDSNSEKYIEGLKQGDFFNTITREVFGPEIYVVPLFEMKTRAKLPPYGEGGPPTCRSLDGHTGEGDPGGECRKCPLQKFANGKPPLCTEFLNFVTLVMPADAKMVKMVWNKTPRVDTVSVLGFKRTSIDAGKQWISLANFRQKDWFSGVYRVISVAKKDGQNSWYIPQVENAGWLNVSGYGLSEPFYKSIKEVYDAGRLRASEDAEQEREPGAEG